jgi:hypothetical protein
VQRTEGSQLVYVTETKGSAVQTLYAEAQAVTSLVIKYNHDTSQLCCICAFILNVTQQRPATTSRASHSALQLLMHLCHFKCDTTATSDNWQGITQHPKVIDAFMPCHFKCNTTTTSDNRQGVTEQPEIINAFMPLPF